MQQEIGEATAVAQRRFYERYPNPEDWTAKRLEELVHRAVKKTKVHYKGELKKMLPVADPSNTIPFLEEVKYHYESHDEDPEMKLEKLWMLGTSVMDPIMKVLWLERWNQPAKLRVQLRFPKPNFSDDTFLIWLHKATWWSQVHFQVFSTKFSKLFISAPTI